MWWPLLCYLFFTKSKPCHWFPCISVCLAQGMGQLIPIYPMGWHTRKWEINISMSIFYECIFVQCQLTTLKIPRHFNHTLLHFQITPSLGEHWKWVWGNGKKTHCFFLHSEALSTVKSGRLTNPSAFSAWNKHIVINALLPAFDTLTTWTREDIS